MNYVDRCQDVARLRLLLRAASRFSEATSRSEIAEQLAEMIVPALADSTAVHLCIAGNEPQLAATRHVEPVKRQALKRYFERYQPQPEALFGLGAVLRTGQSEFISEVQPWMRELQAAHDPELLADINLLAVQSWILAPIVHGDRVFGAFSFASSVSGRRYDEESLRFAEALGRTAGQAMSQASRLEDKTNNVYLAMVAHELRTPLNAILGWTETLRREDITEELRQRGHEVIDRNARAQARLIDDLLDVSRQSDGRLAVRMTGTDMVTVVEAASRSVKPLANAKNVQLETVLSKPRMLEGDAARLTQVVLNLLINAIKFTPSGGRVRVTLDEKDDVCELAVSDTGVGISEDLLPFVFERFRQGGKEHGGLGLGLAIASDLVAEHGGTIGVESAGRGQGATFRVKLPYERPHPDAAAVHTHSRQGIEQTLKGLRVLVAHPNDDTRWLYREALTYCGAKVLSFASLHEIMKLDVDVMLIDLDCVGPDELIAESTPVVALCTNEASHPGLAALCKFELVRKPATPSDVVRAISHLFARRVDTIVPAKSARL